MRAFALILSVASVVSFSSCSTSATGTCSAATCNGCCDATLTCQNGTLDSACGSAANACQGCQQGLHCVSQICTRVVEDGGTGGGTAATGGGSATGGGTAATGGGTAATGGGTASTGGGTAATGGGTGTGGGTSNPGIDGGFSFNTPQVQIQFPPTCDFSPCGGSLSGTYFYTAACIPQTDFDQVLGQLGQLCSTATVTSVDGGLTGFVVVEGTAALRSVQGSVTVSMALTGQLCLTGCNQVSNVSMGGYNVNCGVDGGECDCTATRAIDIADNGQFTTNAANNTLSLVGSGALYEYCVNGTQWMTHQLDAGTGGLEPGIATLTQQN